MTGVMLGSITFRALGIHARRNLDFLMYEHMAHGGRENGRLGASYRQLEAWGATPADIKKGFAELEAAGFIVCVRRGLRQAGGAEGSLYALSWLPRLSGAEYEPPTHEWTRVLAELARLGIGKVSGAKRWLREQTESIGRGSAPPYLLNPTPQVSDESLLIRAAARGQKRRLTPIT